LFPKENIFNNIFIKDIFKVFENFIDDLERELLAVKEIVNIFGKITYKIKVKVNKFKKGCL
jgi:hypothetical protein